MACQIKRDNNGNITEVLALNNKPSILYNSLVSAMSNPTFKQNVLNDGYVSSIMDTEYVRDTSNEEVALAAWSKAYTANFIDTFGKWKDSKLPNTDINGEPLVSFLFETTNNVKPGVSELFESNPELANAVYEALVPTGYTRLYRSENEKGVDFPAPSWLLEQPEIIAQEEAIGRWFYKSYEEAKYHADTFGSSGISYVDIPTIKVENYNAKNNKFSGGYGRDGKEYFIPKEIASQKQDFSKQKQQAQEQYSQYLDTVFPNSKVKDIVYHGTVGVWFKKEKFTFGKGSKKTTNKSSQYGYWFGENKQVANIFNNVDLKTLATDLKTSTELFEEKLNVIQETYKISDDEIDTIVEKTIEYKKASSTDYSKQFYKPSTSNTISVIINAVNPDRVDTLRFAGSTRGDGQNALDYLNTFKGDSLIFEQVEDAGPGGEEFEFGKNYAVKTSEQIHILGSNSDIQQFKQYVQNNPQVKTEEKKEPSLGIIKGVSQDVSNWQTVYNNFDNATNLLSDITTNTKNNSGKILALNLLRFEELQKVEVRAVDGFKMPDGSRAVGYYFPSSQRIDILKNLDLNSFESVFLHEAIHAVTVNEYNSNKEFKNKIDRLYNHMLQFKNNRTTTGELLSTMYGMTNAREFMAEAMSNTKFISELSKYKSPFEESLKEGKSVFLEFIDLIIDMIYSTVKQTSKDSQNTQYTEGNVAEAVLNVINNYAAVTASQYQNAITTSQDWTNVKNNCSKLI